MLLSFPLLPFELLLEAETGVEVGRYVGGLVGACVGLGVGGRVGACVGLGVTSDVMSSAIVSIPDKDEEVSQT